MQCSLKKVLKRQNRFFSAGGVIHFLLGAIFSIGFVVFTSCSSVGKESFIQSVDNFIPGEIAFCKDDIYITVNQIEDKMAQQQIFQGIEPKIKSFNQQCNPAGALAEAPAGTLAEAPAGTPAGPEAYPAGQKGRLVLKINQRSLWEGYDQKNSLAITGEIYNENHELVLQRTVLVSGKASILQVKSQRKYIGSVVDSLTKDWLALAPLESEE